VSKDEGKGVWVGSGGFRVDRARMLEQLARYGFLHAHSIVLAVVRCAVLGQATRVGIKGLAKGGFRLSTYDGLEFEFDGEPLDEAALRRPYDGLFADGPDRRRREQLARALLTLARTEPKELTLRSGPRGRRFELSVRSLTEETVAPVEGSGPTILRVAWEGLGAQQVELMSELSKLVRDRLSHAPIPIDLKDVWHGLGDQRTRFDYFYQPADLFRSEDAAPISAEFDRDGVRGRIEMPTRIVPAAGHVSLCWAGAEVERVSDAGFLPMPVDGFIDHLGFNLDLSAGAVVRDAVFDAAVAELSRAASALAVRAAREQPALMDELAVLMATPAYRETWTKTHDGRLLSEPEVHWWEFRPADSELKIHRRIYWAAARTRWLRYCARGIAGRALPELEAALYAAPLYFSTRLKPLSLAQLGEMMRPTGQIPASARLSSHLGPALWLSSSRDAALLPAKFAITRM
jgi:hypothetical protein